MYPTLSEVPAEASSAEQGNAHEEAGVAQRESNAGIKAANKQKVYVLDGGFVEWQEKYGKDKRLTEAYVEEIWKYGY
jgi:Cdc25 family phosphatase